jgi:hypothetical protein
MSFICYLTLAAFISIISFEVSYSRIQHQKTEVSPNKNTMNTELNFVFEEETNPSDFIYQALLSGIVFMSLTFIASPLYDPTGNFFIYIKYKVPLKTPLCISLRTLRI